MRGVEERPDRLVYRLGVVSAAEEQSLLAVVRDLDVKAVVVRGQTARRTFRHFGYTYSFGSGELVPTDAIPDCLTDVRARCAEMAGVDPLSFAQALVTRYPPAATIGWHRDAPAFGRAVAGLSLGADCVMRFQRRVAGGGRRVFELPLAPRSGYVLAGAARWAWQHSIPAVAQERYSITFRIVKAAGRS